MGITMSQPSNKSMVDELVDKHHYIMSPTVEGAFRAVDRAMYFNLEEGDTFDPYSETPWRDGNIHLSAPCIYAKAIEALDLQPGHSFLNLGSGTGYLNTIAGLIIGPHGLNHGIEYHLDVVEYAHERLERFKRDSFAIDKYDFAEPVFIHGDCVKLNPNSRYDRVYLGAACTPELETFMKKLIKPAGGVLVMPLDCFLLRYIRITEVDWKVEKLMQVSFTLMIREPRGSNDDNKMIDMPLVQPKNLKELCRIRIRRHIRDKTNRENPNLLNSDNIEARKMRKAQAEREMILKQEREFRRNYNVCPYVQEEGGSNGASDGLHKRCRRWPCREFNSLGPKASGSEEGRMMTRSARRRFELSRLFNHFRSSPTPSNSAPGQALMRRDQIDSASDSSSSDNHSATPGHNYSGPVTRGEGCSRTRPFVSRSTRQYGIRERAPSPARLGEPYRVTRSAFPASRRADIHRIIHSSFRPVFMSSPSTASTHSDSSSSSSTRQNEEEDHNRRPILDDFPSILRIRRRALGDLASRALISSFFEPIPDALGELDVDDSDYEEESDDGDSFDDDFNDPDLSGLESFEDEDDVSDESVETDECEESDEDEEDEDNDEEGDEVDDGSRASDRHLRYLSRGSGGAARTTPAHLVPLRSSSSAPMVASSSLASCASSLQQLSRDRRSCHGSNEGRTIANSSIATAVATTMANRRYHCHVQKLADRKRKRHSSSSSCSEASNTSSPSKRGGRNPSDIPTQCCNHHEPDRRASSRARRRCGCPQGPATTMTRTMPDIAAGGGASSLSSRATGGQLVAQASEATSEPFASESSNSMESSHRWTRLRSLISTRAKNYARQASSSGATQSGACLPGSGGGGGGGSDMFAMSASTRRQSDRPAPETAAAPASNQKTTELEGASTGCRQHHRHHHCHSRGCGHAHHRHHHHRYCFGKCSRHRVAASSRNQPGGSAEIESLSSPSSPAATVASGVAAAAAAAAATQSPTTSSSSASFSSACQNRADPGRLKNGDDIRESRQQGGKAKGTRRRSKKKNGSKRRSENECQRYHNHMSTYISQLPVPQVLQSYLNFDRGNI